MNMPHSAAPIIAAMLLVLPVLYVASYLVLVVPSGHRARFEQKLMLCGVRFDTYRYGNGLATRVYWPLEQLDRRFRPQEWSKKIGLEKQGGGSGLLDSRALKRELRSMQRKATP